MKLSVAHKYDISYRSAKELGISEDERQALLQNGEPYLDKHRTVDLSGEKVELEFSASKNTEQHSFKVVPEDKISFKTTRLGQLCGRNEVSIKVIKESKNLGADTLNDKPVEVDRRKINAGISGYGSCNIGWFKVAISGEKILMLTSSSSRTDFIKSSYQTGNTLMVELA
ncbi:hypothetical protein JQC92_10635 [Shewanella sp. 202IG2-18]|uniref:hypothetical protein n=1 Tax=Parashewanella hymeniacidonis TaxID=2807618 RepID=UPI0019609CA9|nr:hypothetical protein [Parashewanella hymeniacidonis]MBM7072484.1 hypothetical protein [Parashewanella hymeniacidonis]